MKIGVLTLPLHINYGGILQAYALQTVLERMGHNVVVFQTEYNGLYRIPLWLYPLFIVKRFLRKCIVDHRALVFWEYKNKKELPVIRQNTNAFILKYIHTYNVKRLKDISSSCVDVIIVGSDQIWRPELVRKMWNTDVKDAYLRFTLGWNVKRIAYAASFGIERWQLSKKDTIECMDLAQKFHAISVREDFGVELCTNYLGVVAEHVLDPTMLLTMSDYVMLLSKNDASKKGEGGLFSYVLDETEEKTQLIQKIAKERKLNRFGITVNSLDWYAPIEKRVVPAVEKWLKCFIDADFVVTDSFHGCVFSILFRKPFIALGNVDRGLGRFVSLLRLFELENHLLVNVNDYSSDVSYDLPAGLDDRLKLMQIKSRDFLLKCLSLT